jgi:hypothetical protein
MGGKYVLIKMGGLVGLFCCVIIYSCAGPITPTPTPGIGSMVVLGYNDLGMHCMNQDFSELMILPPYNTLHAQVIDRRGEKPRIVTDSVTVEYSIPGNTYSVGKTNFWDFVTPLMGVTLAPNIGLAGNGLTGTLSPTGTNDWSAVGIPLTPIMDDLTLNSYALSNIRVLSGGTEVANTQAVVPVSWEISCDMCHNGSDAPLSVLDAHDRLHGTDLQNQKPVLCAKCHQQAPLGPAGVGVPGVSTLSRAMHHAHATRMDDVLSQLDNIACYACHPGKQTQCLRDVHAAKGMNCMSCHTSMDAVADPNRRPWVDEPTCAGCHQSRQPTFGFEQPGTLFRNSKGHHGVHCEACHGSPHAITPSLVAADNVQAITLQGHAGKIDTCSVCHSRQPEGSFDHRYNNGN